MNDYNKIIEINKSVESVYTAITDHIKDWWSNDLTGSSARPGDRFTIAFGNTRKTFALTEAVPNEKVSWKCVEAYIDNPALKNKSEWAGTEMIWTISSEREKTTLSFLHRGLNENVECYRICEAGWDQFLASLEDYLVTGKGSPYLKKIESL